MYSNRDIKRQESNILFDSCLECGELFKLDSYDYIAFHGNVIVGPDGGLVGNNFKEDGTLGNITKFCNKPECYLKVFSYTLKDENKFWESILTLAEKNLTNINIF